MNEESTTHSKAFKRNARVGKNVLIIGVLLCSSLFYYPGLVLNTVDIKGRGDAPAASPNSSGWKERAVTAETNAKIAIEKLEEYEHEHELAPKPSNKHKYAIVHLLSGFKEDYVMALLSSAHRLRKIHAKLTSFAWQLDLVVMVPESADLSGYDHPFIRFVTFDDKYILKALDGKKFWKGTMLKLAAAGLEDYDKVLFLDLDMVVYKELASILVETKPPAMVPWGQYPHMDYNSGFQILRPNKTMLADMLEAMSHLMNSGEEVMEELKQRSTAESVKANLTAGSVNVKQVSNYRGDQEFLFAFYDIIPGTSQKYGPIHALPFRYNARSHSIRITTNALLQGKTIVGEFTSSLLHLYGGFGHDGEGHRLTQGGDETNGLFGLVVVHFTIDKPWSRPICKDISNLDKVIYDTTMTPRERCPEILHQMTFWEGAFAATKEAAMDSRYGFQWTSNSIRDMLHGGKGPCLFEKCLRPERDDLYKILTNMTEYAGVSPKLTTYIPLITVSAIEA